VFFGCGESKPDAPLPEGETPNQPTPNVPEPVEPETPNTPDEPESTDPPSEPESTDPTGATDPPEAAGERLKVPGLSHVLPPGWTVGSPRAMRLLTLVPPAEFVDAELAVSKWPGDVGGFAMNVTRWVRQAGVAPIAVTTASTSNFEQFKLGDTTATWIPLVNEGTNYAIIAAWVPRGENLDQPNETWTFKLTCKAEDAEALSTAIRAWCDTVEFE